MKKTISILLSAALLAAVMPVVASAAGNASYEDFSGASAANWTLNQTTTASFTGGALKIDRGESDKFAVWKAPKPYPSGEVVIEYDLMSTSDKANIYIQNPTGGSVCRLQQVAGNVLQLQHSNDEGTANANTAVLNRTFQTGAWYHIKHIISYRDDTSDASNRTTSSVYVYSSSNELVGSVEDKLYLDAKNRNAQTGKYISPTNLQVFQVNNPSTESDGSVFFDNFAVYENTAESIFAVNKLAAAIKNADAVTDDIELKTTGYGGAQIAWTSSDTSVIDNTGKVSASAFQRSVSMSAAITYNGVTQTVVFPVTVLALDGYSDDDRYFFDFNDNVLPTGFSTKETEGFCGVRNGRLELERPAGTAVTTSPQMTVNFTKMQNGAFSGKFAMSFDFSSTADNGAKLYVQAAPNSGSLLRMETPSQNSLRFTTGGSDEEAVNTQLSTAFVPGRTYKIKLEFDWDNKKCSVYVDGTAVAKNHNLMTSVCPDALNNVLIQHDGTSGAIVIDNMCLQHDNGVYIDGLDYSTSGDSITVYGTVRGAENVCVASAIYLDGMLKDIKVSEGADFELTHENVYYNGYVAKLFVLHSLKDMLPIIAPYETNELEIKTYSTIDARKNLLVRMYNDSPFPNPEGTSDADVGKVGYALSQLYLGENIADANDLLRRALNNSDPTLGEDSGLYFQMALLQRIYHCYNSQLESDVKNKIEDYFYSYLTNFDDASFAEGEFAHDDEGVFMLDSTGNHHVIRRTAYLLGAQMLKNSERYASSTLSDGKTVSEHYDAWLGYWLDDIPYRIKYAPEVEYFSSGYAKYTIDSFLTLYDATESEELKELCRLYLDYLCADAAVLSVNGIFGGARGRSVRTIETSQHAEFYLNMLFYNLNASWRLKNSFDVITGEILNTTSTLSCHPNLMSLATSSYKPPYLLTNISLSERAPYEYWSYPTGRGTESEYYDEETYMGYFETYNPSRYMRYSYVTPDYVVGSMTYDRGLEYTQIQQQNRYVGIHFKNNKVNSYQLLRVFPDSERYYSRGYNDINAAASGSAMIVTSLPEAVFYNPKHHRDIKMGMSKIFYDNHTIDEDGWMFSYTNDMQSYLAIKPSKGAISGWEDETESTVYMLFDTVNIPIVLQAGSKREYGSFGNFVNAVKNTRFEWTGETEFVYQPTHFGKAITFYTDNTVHKIGDAPSPLESEYIVKSPYLRSFRGSGEVLIQNLHGNSLVLDFNMERD